MDWFMFFIFLTGYGVAAVVNIIWSIAYERLNRDWYQTCIDNTEDWYEECIKLIDECFGNEEKKEGEA